MIYQRVGKNIRFLRNKDILEQDLNINKEAEIEMLINIIMFSLKK